MKPEIKHRSELHKIIDLSLPVAEIGVAEGLFSRDMLAWGVKKLYMVDVWGHIPNITGDGNSPQEWHNKNLENARKITASFSGEKIFLQGFSTDMATLVPDDSLGLVYLDACHSYDCVLADLQAWIPKLINGGVMAGHDYLMPEYGVYQAVKTFTRNKYDVFLIEENEKKDAGFYFYKK